MTDLPSPPFASPGTALAEAERIAALHDLEVLDSMPEPVFDAITEAAARMIGAPIALISLVDEHRQWFKSAVGLGNVAETPRDVAFCDHAIRDTALFEVPDATLDARFAGNPLVTGQPDIRFYAGAPVVMPGGHRIGTVCVIDREPRRLDDRQRVLLESFARIVSSSLTQRRELLGVTRRFAESESHYRAIVEDQSELISQARPDGTLTFVNAAYARHFGRTPEQMVGRNLLDFVADPDRDAVRRHLDDMFLGSQATSNVNRMKSAAGLARCVAWTNRPLFDAQGRPAGLQSVGRDITEQRLAEERLAESEARMRGLYEATPAILHSIDAEGRIVHVSDRWLRLMGYERNDVVGRQSAEFLTPESRARARDEVMPRFFRTGECDRVEYQFIRRDGTLLDVLLSATLERDAHGIPVRSLAVLEDVTANRRLSAELDRTHAHLDAVVDNMPALVGYWDRQAVTRFANRDFQAAVGLPTNRIIGRSLPEIFAAVDPQGYAAIEPRVQDVLAGRRQEFECAVLTTSGLRQLSVTLVPAQPEAGRIDGFYGTWFDITGMKALELRQRDSEQRYRLLFDHLHSAHALHAIEVDAEGRPVNYRFLAMNPAFCSMLGIDAGKAIGALATDVFPQLADDSADWIGKFGRVALEGDPVRFEQRSSTGRWWNVVAYRPAPGQFAVIADEITDRKRLEAAVAERDTRLATLERRFDMAGAAN